MFKNCYLVQILSTVGDTWINLTQMTIHFCRHFLNVTESCALLARNESVRHEAETLLKDFAVSFEKGEGNKLVGAHNTHNQVSF